MIYLLSIYVINESIWFIMVKKITKLIVNDLSKYANYNTDQKEQIEYSLAIIIYELIKFIFLLLSLYFRIFQRRISSINFNDNIQAFYRRIS